MRGRNSRHLDSEGGGAATASFFFLRRRGLLAGLATSDVARTPTAPSLQPIIEIGVVIHVEGKRQAALDARYGTGVVRLSPALKPASQEPVGGKPERLRKGDGDTGP